MNEDDLQRLQDAFVELGRAIIESIEPMMERIKEVFDSLEPYQKYELLHPRKKPRGSIRRSKRNK